MNEYIFEISEALYNEETGEAVMMPTYKGKIVRCKDCRYYYPAEYDKKGNTCLLLREMINAPIWVKEDDYCSKGVSADNGKERTV